MPRPLLRAGAVGVVLVAGCALRGPRVEVRPATVDELLGALTARRAALTSLRARAQVRTGLARLWTREAIVVQRPNDVRIDVLSPFGLALALGTDGSVLWAYPPAEGTRYEGPATPANLARFLGTPVAVGDLADILLGLPPPRVAVDPPRLELTRERRWRVTLPLESGLQSLWFAGDTHDLLATEEARRGVVVLRVAFGDYREGFPHLLEVAAPGTSSTATLAYEAVEPNARVDAALFAPPPAARVLPLDAAALEAR
ncbi:MAG TPA: hypothetical protein VKW76_05160 [Candidatus Binatia bacterium]|nr:hypothetical protein [Candidatus Binatia bacterium]